MSPRKGPCQKGNGVIFGSQQFFQGRFGYASFFGGVCYEKEKMFCPKWDEKKASKNPVFPTNYPNLQCEKKKVGGKELVNYLLKPVQKKKLQKLRSSFIKQHHRNDSQLNEPLRFSGPLSLNRSQDHPPNLVKDMIPVASGKGWDIPGSIVDFWQPGRECNEKTLMQLAHSSSILAQMTSKSEAKWICLDVPGT